MNWWDQQSFITRAAVLAGAFLVAFIVTTFFFPAIGGGAALTYGDVWYGAGVAGVITYMVYTILRPSPKVATKERPSITRQRLGRATLILFLIVLLFICVLSIVVIPSG